MLKINELIEEWEKDSKINETNLKREVLNIPVLHAKYLRFLNEYKLAMYKIKFEYNKMENLRYNYYLGNLDDKTLNEYGWEQFELHVSKTGAEKFLNSDEILNKLEQKKYYYEQTISICESVLSELKSRTFQIKAVIDLVKFEHGG